MLPRLSEGRSEIIEAAVGEHTSTTLPDGSSIALNAASRMTVRFSKTERQVRLDRGEALFDVHPDAARPFIVQTDFGRLRVTGTSFLVRVDADSARATVLRGAVEGRSSRHDLGSRIWRTGSVVLTAPVVAHAGEELYFTPASVTVASISTGESDRRLAWRTGMLAFNGETLLQATAEVTRQTGLTFEFADPALGQLRIGGYIKADDPVAFLQLLRDNFGIVADRPTARRARLSRANALTEAD